MRRGGEKEKMKWRSSPEQAILLQSRGGAAQEGLFLSFVQQEAPASLYFSSQEKTDVSFGVPPPHRLHVWVCSFLPASLFFSSGVWLKRGSGLLMRFLRHTVQGFSSERCVPCPA